MNVFLMKTSISLDHGKCDETRWCLQIFTFTKQHIGNDFKTSEAEEGRALAERT